MQLGVGSEGDEDIVSTEYLSSQVVEEDDRSRWYYALRPGASQQDARGSGILVGVPSVVGGSRELGTLYFLDNLVAQLQVGLEVVVMPPGCRGVHRRRAGFGQWTKLVHPSRR